MSTALSCQRKCVFAHFMVGNTHPYKVQDWMDDIQLAHESGFDGFALNVGSEDWQVMRVTDCYEAARKIGLDFKLFISLDMERIPCESEDSVKKLLRYLRPSVGHGNQYRREGKYVVSTFAGQGSKFGHKTFGDGWAYAKEQLEKVVGSICFIPSFFIKPQEYPSLKFMDGYFNWNGSWPIPPDDSSHKERVETGIDTDKEHLRHLKRKTFMAAVSPWFFTHYGRTSWNKNWIYRGDDHLFVRRWEQVVDMRDEIDIVQVISWNDYGESHYVGPIKGAQPNSQAWVDGFPHEAWLKLNKYFSLAFKNNRYPEITEDGIFIWGRPHPKRAQASDDRVPAPKNWDLTEDKFWVVVLATAPGTVRLTSGEYTELHTVGSGLSKLSHPLALGGSMKAKLFRGGNPVAEIDAAGPPFRFKFDPSPRAYNFNVLVAKSL